MFLVLCANHREAKKMLLHADSDTGARLLSELEPKIAIRRSADSDVEIQGSVRPRLMYFSQDPSSAVHIQENFGTSANDAVVVSDEAWRSLVERPQSTNRVSVSHAFYKVGAAGSLSVPRRSGGLRQLHDPRSGHLSRLPR